MKLLIATVTAFFIGVAFASYFLLNLYIVPLLHVPIDKSLHALNYIEENEQEAMVTTLRKISLPFETCRLYRFTSLPFVIDNDVYDKAMVKAFSYIEEPIGDKGKYCNDHYVL